MWTTKTFLKKTKKGNVLKVRLYKAGHWPRFVAQCTRYVASVVDIANYEVLEVW